MEGLYSVKLSQIIKEFKLEVIYAPEGYEKIAIYSDDVNRPGLQLAGFFDYFDSSRIQLLGKVETTYIESFSSERRRDIFDRLFAKHIPALVIARGIDPYSECREMAEKHGVPLLRTIDPTSYFMSALIASLKVQLAPRITRHGVLMEVYGEGILLTGDSGVGKSENAIELVKRGHRLIADDAVEIKKVSAKTLVGSAPDMIRHYIELRGIGVIDVRRLFGMGAVKMTQGIDLMINVAPWEDDTQYDRLGLEDMYTSILDVKIPYLNVPIKPGRNLAVIIEVAAMNNRHKKMGFNAAREFTDRLDRYFEEAMQEGDNL
ncbi:HPr(Ser) kinase/phosphatase [Oscillospiraceae bacterium OttesenSCG-928-G22]|nr:HPr(Ser) kinase/phosphatase [Oscillospiraceae bacterium OttesenSCG-928-G22]